MGSEFNEAGGATIQGTEDFWDRMPQTLTYNGDGTVNTITATWNGNTWIRTFTYTSGKVTGISAWVKQ